LFAAAHLIASHFGALLIENCPSRGVQRTKLGLKPSTTLGIIVPGTFTPVLAKYMKQPSFIDVLLIRIDRIQRDLEPMKKQLEACFEL